MPRVVGQTNFVHRNISYLRLLNNITHFIFNFPFEYSNITTLPRVILCFTIYIKKNNDYWREFEESGNEKQITRSSGLWHETFTSIIIQGVHDNI